MMKTIAIGLAVLSVSSAWAAKSPTPDEAYRLLVDGKLGACSLVESQDPTAQARFILNEFGRTALCGPQGVTGVWKALSGSGCWIDRGQFAQNPASANQGLGKALLKYMKDGHCQDQGVDPLQLEEKDLAGTYSYSEAAGVTVTLKADAKGKITSAEFNNWARPGDQFTGEVTRYATGAFSVKVASNQYQFDLIPINTKTINLKFNDTLVIRAGRGRFLTRP